MGLPPPSFMVSSATDCGQLAAVDPGHRLIGLHLYDGLFKAESSAYVHIVGQDMFVPSVNR